MDVIFDSQQLKELTEACMKELYLQQEIMDRYMEILDEIAGDDLIQGKMHDAVSVLKSSIYQVFVNSFQTVSQNLDTSLKSFLYEIDKADGITYGASD